MTKSVLTASLLALVLTGCLPGVPSSTDPRSAMAALVPPTKAKAKPDTGKQVTVKYDKFDSSTKVDSASADLDSGLSMSFYFTSQGSRITRPKEVSMMILSISKDWRYADINDLTLIVDGSKEYLGSASRISNVRSGFVSEALFWRISPDLFEKIASASTVEGKLFTTVINFTAESRAPMKDLLKWIPSADEYIEAAT